MSPWKSAAMAAAVAMALVAPSMAQDAHTELTFEDVIRRAEVLEKCKGVDLRSLLVSLERWPSLGQALADVALDPGDAGSQNDLGNQLARVMLFDLAQSAYRCSVEANPRFSPAWNNLGLIFMARGEAGNAQDAFRRATEIDPTNALAFYHRALAHDMDRDYDAAIRFYEWAITLDPRLATARYNPDVVRNTHQIPLFLRRLMTDQALRFNLQSSDEAP